MATEVEEDEVEYFPRTVDQKFYQLSLLAGSGVAIGSLYIAYKYGSFIPVPSSASIAVRLGYTCRCLALPCLSPMLSVTESIVARVGAKVWPMTGRDHLLPQLQRNVLMNTIEQFGVFAVSLLALGASLQTPKQLRLIPTMCVLFVAGRLLFRVGYPDNRAFGFNMNYTISTINILAVAYLTCRNGLLSGLEV